MKVLIFGGTGAMGKYLSEILSAGGADTYVTTRQKRPDHDGINYLCGDAHDTGFVRSLLDEGKYDAVVDFMSYVPAEFQSRAGLLTSKCGHYIFLSSSRVYADSVTPIRETSARLLDVSTDTAYLETDEYALSKAREENMLMSYAAKNWTIIRPYITYSNERLQLGVYEKERWLWRALHGRPVVFSDDIADTVTTLTWGHDVSEAIAGLIGRPEAYGGIYHITGDEAMKWRDIAEIYKEVFAQATGREMKIVYVPKALDDTAQVKYDRLYNRVFDNSKIKSAVREFRPVSIREGLTRCLTEFVRDNHPFRGLDYLSEAKMDRITGSSSSSDEFTGMKTRIKYYMYRYCPVLGRMLTSAKRAAKKILHRH